MVKIVTKADIIKKKALNKPARQVNLGSMEPELESTDQSYVQDIIDEHRKKLELHTYDREKEETLLRTNLAKAGVLQVDKAGNVLRDSRITPRDEKKLLEFASQLTEGDRSLVVEFAGDEATVYRKSSGDADKPEIVELADLSTKKSTKQRI